MTTRRRFLQTLAGTTSLGLAETTGLRGLAALAAEAAPAKIRFGSDLEPIVDLIERTPRAECPAVLIEQLRLGLPYRRFLAAAFYHGIRRLNSNHDVYKIAPVHQVSLELRPQERLLPVFWAIDGNKQHQEDFPTGALAELSGTVPSADKAAAEFDGGLLSGDLQRAERAVVMLARTQGARQTLDRLWPYGARNGGLGGHAAIVVTSCYRALETIGWQEAEPVLRFVVRDLYELGGHGKPDAYWPANVARADEHLDKLPVGWTGAKGDEVATVEMLALLRSGRPEDACAEAIEQLGRGVQAQALWDAVHLATAEMMIRHYDGWGLASRPLHSNTSVGALHYAFSASGSSRTRLLALLQALAWAGDKTRAELASKSLRDMRIIDIAAATLPERPDEAVDEIFGLLPERSYHWDNTNKKAVLTYGKRSDADEASRKVFSLASQRPEAVPLYRRAALSWLCQKASSDAHDYKFLAAILEESQWVSSRWQPHLLAASVHYTHGRHSPDHPVVQQVREAVGRLG